MRLRLMFVLIMMLLFIQEVYAAHYIAGKVNDSYDGVLANDHTVILWNPFNGISDNVTDRIGINGNSGESNYYMIDCELLNIQCNIGDLLDIKVIDNGDNKMSYTVPVIVTGSGFDVAPALIINSIPNVSLNFPHDNANLTSNTVDFNCSTFDSDNNLKNISLYGNWTGIWEINETRSAVGFETTEIFTKIISDGVYSWNCLAYDNLSQSNLSEFNKTFTIDSTPPNITDISINITNVCGTSIVRINCTLTDNLIGINNVLIEAFKPLGTENFSTSFLSGNTYYSDIITNQIGNWTFNCIANDSFGNIANKTSGILTVNNSYEISINGSLINFSDLNPLEYQEILINATVYNNGCADIDGLLVGFFKGDPSLGNQIGSNKTIQVPRYSNSKVNMSWNTVIGFTNIFVFADINNTFNEPNETNNLGNKTIWITAWQKIYGNVSSDKNLGNAIGMNLSAWLNQSNVSGNIFIADSESLIDWFSLQAIGRNILNQSISNDFNDIDSLLNMTTLNDSVYNIFTNSGNPKTTGSFLIHNKIINNVPIINSTNNSNFITGILWDTSKDSGNGEYDTIDKESLVFITKINSRKQGYYGVYDYELTIPARLRQYNDADTSSIYLYYDLV